MKIQEYIYRLTTYIRKHGLGDTLVHIRQKMSRLLFPAANNLYYVELQDLPEGFGQAPMDIEIVCRHKEAELSQAERCVLADHLGPMLYQRLMKERFEQRESVLWLAKQEEFVQGFMWTIVQNTVKSFYWPLTCKDVHFYHVMVFSGNRGRGIAGKMTCFVLGQMKRQGYKRAFVEVLITNSQSNHYISKTPFVQYGVGRRFSLGRYQIGLFRRNWKSSC
jgi:hypothetical protein